MKQDIYSHRLVTGSIGHTQHNIACENLMRFYPNKVNVEHLALKPCDEDKAESCIKKLISSLANIANVHLISADRNLKYLIAEEWVVSIEIEYQLDSLERRREVSVGKEREQPIEGGATASKCNTGFVRRVYLAVTFIKLPLIEKVKKICVSSGFHILEEFEVEKGIPVTFAFPGKMGPEFSSQSFDRLPLKSIEGNYDPSAIDMIKDFLEQAGEVSHGLLLISGPVGTGKSYLIRAILTELKQRRAVICTPPSQFLVQAGLLAQVVTNFRKSLIVLEDVGEVVSMDAASVYMDARANLLNFTEGFLSLLTDTIVIISFNYDIDKIDPAIIRPGRCLANIVVKLLPYEHAQRLVDFNLKPRKAYSLAEVYEMRRVGKADIFDNHGELGFNR